MQFEPLFSRLPDGLTTRSSEQPSAVAELGAVRRESAAFFAAPLPPAPPWNVMAGRA